MKTSAKLTIRASEVRSEINKLEPGDKSVEKRRELMASLDTIETEFRTAVEAEAKDEGTEHRGGDGLTAEERERRGLEKQSGAAQRGRVDHQWARAVRRRGGVPARDGIQRA